MLISSPATAASSIWTVPDGGNSGSGAINTPGADWYNADTNIMVRMPFGNETSYTDDTPNLFDPEDIRQYTAPTIDNTDVTNYSGASRPNSALGNEEINPIANIVTAFSPHNVIAGVEEAYATSDIMQGAVLAGTASPIDEDEVGSGYGTLANMNDNNVFNHMDESARNAINGFNR